jgi:hypothetical protein
MIEFGDTAFYIDLKAFENAISVSKNQTETEIVLDKETKHIYSGDGELLTTETFQRTSPQNKEIDATKYDVLKSLLDFIIDDKDVNDDTLGTERAFRETTFSYRLVFNTLLHEGIIKERE